MPRSGVEQDDLRQRRWRRLIVFTLGVWSAVIFSWLPFGGLRAAVVYASISTTVMMVVFGMWAVVRERLGWLASAVDLAVGYVAVAIPSVAMAWWLRGNRGVMGAAYDRWTALWGCCPPGGVLVTWLETRSKLPLKSLTLPLLLVVLRGACLAILGSLFDCVVLQHTGQQDPRHRDRSIHLITYGWRFHE